MDTSSYMVPAGGSEQQPLAAEALDDEEVLPSGPYGLDNQDPAVMEDIVAAMFPDPAPGAPGETAAASSTEPEYGTWNRDEFAKKDGTSFSHNLETFSAEVGELL